MPYIGTSPSNSVRRVHTYTATASQTTFTGASSEGVTLSYADTNYIDVFQNGVLLGNADYTSTSGTSVVLAQGASADDLIVIVVYDVFSVADTVSKTNGGSFDSAITMSNNLTVSGAFTSQGIDDNASSTALKLDSSGNLLVGKTSDDNSAGISLRNTGEGYFVRDGANTLALNRLSSDGDIINFFKDTSAVGSIGSVSSGANLYISANSGVGLGIGDDNIYPVNASGSSTNGSLDIGDASARFKDLYLSGGVYLGGTGSANKLSDVETGTWTPTFRNDGSTTYSINVGRYVKIGQLVIAAAHLDVTTNNIGTNAIQVETLPFTSINDNVNAYGNSSSLHCNNWNSSNKPDHFIISPNSTFATGYGSAGQAGLAFPNGNDLGGGNLIVTFIYRTA